MIIVDIRQSGTWDESKQTQPDTICPYCGVGCTLQLRVQDNRIVKVTSPMDHEQRTPVPLGTTGSRGDSRR